MRRIIWIASVLSAAACGGTTGAPPPEPRSQEALASTLDQAAGPAATAVIEGRSGSKLSGSAKFVAIKDGLGVHVEVKDAEPGLHGVHIHQKGDCSDPTAASAGPHYDPASGGHHGGPSTAVRHGGDLGNLEVDASGKGSLNVVVQGLSVASVGDGVVTHSIVVHEKADDLQTDPSGNSGNRIGCGLILSPPVH